MNLVKLRDRIARRIANSIWTPELPEIPERYRPIDLQYIVDRLPSDPVIVEAGAHDGGNTLELAKIPGAQLHCFEPIPDVFKKLEQRTKHLSNVSRYPSALGEFCGTTAMFVSSGMNDASSSVFKPKDVSVFNPDLQFDATTEVQIVTLDDWASGNGIQKVDFFWLDMQGYELPAMKAGCRILDTVSVIYTEVNLLEVYEQVPLYHEVWKWLSSKGFRIEKTDFPWPDQGEVLFVR